ncbi:nitrogenase [bacterium]|nr:nitrogenase [bacterium]
MSRSSEKAPASPRGDDPFRSAIGAGIAFRGFEGVLPLIAEGSDPSGSIRHYILGQFGEALMESVATGFASTSGGPADLEQEIERALEQNHPDLVAIVSAEGSGETVSAARRLVKGMKDSGHPGMLVLPPLSTAGGLMAGFHQATRSVVRHFARGERENRKGLVIFPGLLSPADLRHLKEIVRLFGLDVTFVPDYAETLDGRALTGYEILPEGGTPLQVLRDLSISAGAISLTPSVPSKLRAGAFLHRRWGVPERIVGVPLGLGEMDRFLNALEEMGGCEIPEPVARQRDRLVESYVDAHGYLFQKRAVLHAEEDLLISLTLFLAETGVLPVVCATLGRSGRLAENLKRRLPPTTPFPRLLEGVTFPEIEEVARQVRPDFLMGNSDGYPLARSLNVPLVRVGFPIHDRIGSQRTLSVGYRGTHQVFDAIVNEILRRHQDEAPVGYSHL